MEDDIVVSIVMPVFNEEKFIDKCIRSLLQQDYSVHNMEWIFVDGCSTDKTVEKINTYALKNPVHFRVFNNPKKIVPYAMNIGIAESSGKYIIRLDAHADYAPNYISKCVYFLEKTDAENVGGVVDTKAEGFIGRSIAKILSSKFGVGNSRFRTNGNSGYVDTVPFGAFKREVFSKYGGYDERLVRNQDNELNYRIRKHGGKIFLSNEIRSSYYCRDSIKELSQMAKNNGTWNIITTKLCPGSMGLRHFIPLIFVLSIVFITLLGFIHPLFLIGLGIELSLYFMLDMFFSCKQADSFIETLLLLILFPVFHISYGSGSIIGFFKLFTKQYRSNGYQIKKF